MNTRNKNPNDEHISHFCDSHCTQINLSLVPYWFLACIRIALTLLPQTGYIHPDEYFQSLEVISGDVFDVDVSVPWEFNATFPIRSLVIPYITVGIPLMVLKTVAPFLMLWFNINIQVPYFLLILPRLFVCLSSFACDYALYRICYFYAQNYRTRLITFASSYVVLIYGTRTFSNSIEMILMSLLLFFVADSMRNSDQIIYQDEYLSDKWELAEDIREKVKFHKLRKSLGSHTFSHCLLIATICVAGIFNRPTFLVFAFPPVFFWLHRGLGSKYIGLQDFHYRIILFIISALPSVFLFVVFDSFYYGYLTWNEMRESKISLTNFVVTPLNFIIYNTNFDNLEHHGLHPRYLHFVVNIPLLYNVLGIVAVFAFIRMIFRLIIGRWSDLPRVQSIIGLMMLSFIIPIAGLSLFPHQEPRFLIPVTLPLVFLHCQRIRHTTNIQKFNVSPANGSSSTTAVTFSSKTPSRNVLLNVWYLINICLALFYGFVHQAGVYPLTQHFYHELQTKPKFTHIHLVTSNLYSLPVSLLQLKNTRKVWFNEETGFRYRNAKEFFLYEMGSSSIPELTEKIASISEGCTILRKQKKVPFRLYLAIPASLAEEFFVASMNSSFKFTSEKVFYPHISTEALPNVLNAKSFEVNFKSWEFMLEAPTMYLSRFIQQFGLKLIKIIV